MNFRSGICAVLALLAIAPGVPAETIPATCTLPLIRTAQNDYRVRASINGKEALLLLDTGSPLSCLNEARSNFFGLTPFAGNDRVPSATIVNGKRHRVTMVSNASFGSLQVKAMPYVLVDLREMGRDPSGAAGQAPDGILGLDFLSALRAVIDFPAQRIVLRPATGNAPDRWRGRTGSTEVPLQIAGNHLVVKGAVNRSPLVWIVDTGAPFAVLDRKFSDRARLRLSRMLLSSSAIHFKDETTRVARLKQMSIGSFETQNQAVMVFDLSKLLQNNSSMAAGMGLLGLNTLEMHDAVIDCGGLRLFLLPPAR